MVQNSCYRLFEGFWSLLNCHFFPKWTNQFTISNNNILDWNIVNKKMIKVMRNYRNHVEKEYDFDYV